MGEEGSQPAQASPTKLRYNQLRKDERESSPCLQTWRLVPYVWNIYKVDGQLAVKAVCGESRTHGLEWEKTP